MTVSIRIKLVVLNKLFNAILPVIGKMLVDR